MFTHFLLTGIKPPEDKWEALEDCHAFVYNKQLKKLFLHEGVLFNMEVRHRLAIGTGKDFARMAMHLGKTAKEAVELTSNFDSNTNNKVDVFDLNKFELEEADITSL